MYQFRSESENDESNRGGVAFCYKAQYENQIEVVKAYNGDFLWIKLNAKYFDFSNDVYICIAYVPPENSPIWQRAMFDPFDLLEQDIVRFSSRGTVIVGGDFNARTKTLSEDELETSVKQWSNLPQFSSDDYILYQRNNSDCVINNFGRSLIELCQSCQLRIVNGRTLGDCFGNYTCYHYNGCSVVDYALVQPSVFKIINYFQVKPLSYLSDHCPITLEFNAGIRKCRTEQKNMNKYTSSTATQTKKINTRILRYIWDSESAEKYNKVLRDPDIVNMSNHFLMSHYGNSPKDVDEAAKFLNSILLQTANKSLKLVRCKKTKTRKKQWFDQSCKEIKQSMLNALYAYKVKPFDSNLAKKFYTCKKKFKKLCKFKEKEYRNNLLNKLETLSASNPKEYWKLIRQLTADDNDKDSDKIDINSFYQHFENLNADNSKQTPFHERVKKELSDTEQIKVNHNIQELNEAISADDIRIAFKALKSKKANGPDLILNEMLKCSGNFLIDHIMKLFNLILDSGSFPSIWSTSYITPIFKGGNALDGSNYRGIAVGSSFGKLFLSILNRRLSKYLENNDLLDECQAGFRKDYRTTDNIFIIKTLMNKYKANKKKLFLCFVDFKKAFDSVWRTGLFYKLQKLNVTGKVYNVIKSLYENVTYMDKTQTGVSDELKSLIGAAQASPSW